MCRNVLVFNSLRSWRYCVLVELDLAAEPLYQSSENLITQTASYAGYVFNCLKKYQSQSPFQLNITCDWQIDVKWHRLRFVAL